MASLWTHIGYARLAALLGERAGLHFAPNRQPAAEAGMRRVLEAERLADPVRLARRAAEDPEVLDAVLAEVTIGETYFFREPAQLGVIRTTVLPGFRNRRTPEHPLRVWSAGCATGEELYTLAILLREGGWATAATLLGTDLSRPRLAAAERARYTRWSLRGMDEEAIDRYFLRRGKHFLLRPEIRALAELRPLNLASDDYPGGSSGIGDMDLILCRNVLIYFDRPAVAAVARRLLDSLSDDGWLFLGASDPMLADLVPCEPVVTGAGLAYRKAGTAGRKAGATVAPAARGDLAIDAARGRRVAAGEEAIPIEIPPAHPSHPPAHPTAARDAGRAGPASRSTPDATAERREATPERQAATEIRALADGGQVADAELACVRALERHPDSLELTYLHAVLLAARGQYAAAAAAARRALYLDRTLAVAHLLLGTALAREGHEVLARRALRTAERLLAAHPADAPVPLAGGESARRLREAARTQQRLLGEAVA